MLTLTDALGRSRLVAAHRPAIVCGEQVFDHAALAERSERVAGALAGLGLSRGDRVAVLAANCHRYVELYFGAPGVGMVLLPLNIRLAEAELLEIVAGARPRVLITDRDPGGLAAEVERVIPFDEWDAIVDASPRAEVGLGAGVTENDLAVLYFTGGTTGRPKGVMLSHRNLVANALHKTIACGLQGSDVFLASGPFFHVAGTAPVLSILWLGGSLTVLPGFDAGRCLDVIERHGVTVYMPVPTMLATLCAEQQARPRDVSSLRLIGHAGSPITTAVIREAHQTFPDIQLDQYYGATETASIVTCLSHEERLLDGGPLGSVGQPVVGVAVDVVDADGKPRPPGEVGEVVARGPNVTAGYWENDDATKAAFVDGWYRMGDVGYLDDERNLWLLDRAKDMIVTGGENVYSIEVEEVLARHPAVVECAVFGIPDEQWVEAVHAVVVVAPEHVSATLPDELRAHCRTSIAGFKVPKRIELQTEALPKSGPGKIQKRQLRAPYWDS
jgi:acyl-CoA synthetase (AMP-forming)/AMP-acid ligase II